MKGYFRSVLFTAKVNALSGSSFPSVVLQDLYRFPHREFIVPLSYEIFVTVFLPTESLNL